MRKKVRLSDRRKKKVEKKKRVSIRTWAQFQDLIRREFLNDQASEETPPWIHFT